MRQPNKISKPVLRPSRTGPLVVKAPSVKFGMPSGELFVGSYHRIPVRRSNVAFEDIEFVVPDGPKAGLISQSRDRLFAARREHVMLCVGYEPGVYTIEARLRSNGSIIGSATFTSGALWLNEDLGPSKWFTGIVRGFSAGSAWGGGPAGPQNSGTIPQSGTRRIAVLLVDTNTQRFTTNSTDLQGHRDRWLNELVNGVTQGGVTRSAAQYFREVSLGAFDLSAQVFGPVELPGTFDDYFNTDGSPKGTYYQACFTAGDSLINYNDFDTLLCVSQPVTGTSPRAAWPYASIGDWGPYTTADGNQNYGVISFSNEWGVTSNREIHETFCHELGHNLGMGDQYTPAVPGRNPGNWEMMDGDNSLPHFSLSHRLALGWAQPGWVETFDFKSMAAPVDRTVTLSAIEAGAPPTGRRAGIEIRIADGWNYYFEYRNGQGGHIGDQNLPTSSRVLGTDVVSPPFTAPISRPHILLLNNDIDGDGAVLGNSQDYEETDTTDPVFPTDFRMDVSGIDGSKADVRVRYGVNSRPDPSIRPWPASPDRQWQSPDIEVRNARNMADPAWFNVPWVGNSNTVIAKVRNAGGLDAPAVRVNFYVKDYTVGGTPETFINTDVRDVAAGATVEFSCNWVPPSEGHFCIIARIALYQLPANPAVVEMTELNNIAQSNYDRFISATSIPSRELSVIEVGNPYPVRTRIWINAGNSNPLYRTYLEHAWVYLNPGETRRITVMYEYAPDHLTNGLYPDKLLRRYREMQKKTNRVAFAAYAEDPRDNPRHAIEVLGGAQAEIATGRSTKFERFAVSRGGARGTVVTVSDKQPVSGGKVILRIASGRAGGEQLEYQTLELRQGGFSADLRHPGERVKAYFIPPEGLGDCETEDVKPK